MNVLCHCNCIIYILPLMFRTNNRVEAMNGASWKEVPSQTSFHHLVELCTLEVKKSRRTMARADAGAQNVPRVREQERQVGAEMLRLIVAPAVLNVSANI